MAYIMYTTKKLKLERDIYTEGGKGKINSCVSIIPYGQGTSVRLLAHSHLGHHQGDEGLKCKLSHQCKL